MITILSFWGSSFKEGFQKLYPSINAIRMPFGMLPSVNALKYAVSHFRERSDAAGIAPENTTDATQLHKTPRADETPRSVHPSARPQMRLQG